MAQTALPAAKARTKTSTAGNRGFTLLELIIVLFIAGIAAAVVLVSVGRLHDRAVFNEEARKVFQTLKRAREISLFERREVTFKVNEEGTGYWLDLGKDRRSDSHSVRGGLSVRGEEIFFFPKGNSTGGLIKVSNGKGQEYTIKVDPVLGLPSIRRF